eukprot:TRINITY_DN64682_c0_g1_i1.p1 TRINITY_DN64682_c0_g1~~TRINITY_DN64682_c0_g1_i1.p1  ORF type:complete len:391 (+),score=24.08 TRINITY_DN64682_c0_g1_i1:46-1218(+)
MVLSDPIILVFAIAIFPAVVCFHLSEGLSTLPTDGRIRELVELGAGKAGDYQFSPPPADVCNSADFGGDPAVLVGLMCSGPMSYRKLWSLGVILFGAERLVDLIRHSSRSQTHLRGQRLLFWHDMRDSSAASTLHEQQDDCYDLHKRCRNLTDDDWIVDVGSYLGIAALNMLRCTGRGKILVIEPSPWSYFWMRLNLLANAPFREGFALRVGLSTNRSWTSGSHYTYRGWYGTTDSQFIPEAVAHPHVDRVPDANHMKVTRYDVEGVPFSSLLDAAGISSRPALMKLDCELCEYGLVADWFLSAFNRTPVTIVGEIHLPCMKSWKIPDDSIGRCTPPGLPFAMFKRVWSFLCEKHNFLAENCYHPHLRKLHSPWMSHTDAVSQWLQKLGA